MFEIGKTFVRNGKIFCLIEMVNYNNESYGVFSVEDNDKKTSFIIYKIIENNSIYDLLRVTDKELMFRIFEMIERENV